jgi:nuclear pore complex protein Nup155
MLLGLASGNTFLENADASSVGTITMVGSDVANIAKQAFYDFGERPVWTERVTYGTSLPFLFSPSSHLPNIIFYR